MSSARTPPCAGPTGPLRATGGNPFLLTELVRAWKRAGDVAELPATLELRRWVTLRIADAGEDPARLADAVAILGATTWPSPTPPASPAWRQSTPAARRTG